MSRGTTRRVVTRAAAVLLGAVVGMVLLSGTGQPVTAQAHAGRLAIAAPPASVRTDALGVLFGHRVELLGGRRSDGAGTASRTARQGATTVGVVARGATEVLLAGQLLVASRGRVWIHAT